MIEASHIDSMSISFIHNADKILHPKCGIVTGHLSSLAAYRYSVAQLVYLWW